MNNKFLLKKAYEISYALYRLAEVAHRRSYDVATRLEAYGVDIINLTSAGTPGEVIRHMDGLEYLLMLGSDTSVLHYRNAETTMREVARFREALRVAEEELAQVPQVKLAHFSSWNTDSHSERSEESRYKTTSHSDGANPPAGEEATKESRQASNNVAEANALLEQQTPQFTSSSSPSPRHPEGFATKNPEEFGSQRNDPISAFEEFSTKYEKVRNYEKNLTHNHNEEKIGSELNGRHETILGRIAENGNCRTKEIKELFPDLSSRTIRYDLQKLLDRGLIERKGNGGPATYYVLAEKARV